jgi:hypothetical protein
MWKHLDRCVFDGSSPNIAEALSHAREELYFWSLPGLSVFNFSLPLCQTVVGRRSCPSDFGSGRFFVFKYGAHVFSILCGMSWCEGCYPFLFS